MDSAGIALAGRRAASVYRLLGAVGIAKDIVWWTPEEVEEWRNVKSHFITRVMREYQPDGLYFDGQYTGDPAALYALARRARELLGEAG